MQRAQVTELVAAWGGPGADSATRFLQRHCDAAAEVAAHVRAGRCRWPVLRCGTTCGAKLSVDGKVATAVAIDERRLAERSAWLASRTHGHRPG